MLAVAGLLAGGVLTPAPAVAAGAPAAAPALVAHSVTTDRYESEVVAAVNAARAERGLRRLSVSAAIGDVARAWSKEMASTGVFKHNPRFSSQYPAGWTMASENVAYRWQTGSSVPPSRAVHEALMDSPGHRDNILDPRATHIGVGATVVRRDGRTYVYVTENFAAYRSLPDDQPPTYHLNNGWGPWSDRSFTFGRAGDEVLVGDWDGDGVDTIMVRRGNTYLVNNSQDRIRVERTVTYGRAGDVALVGDWNGDGVDSIALRRGKTYFVKNSLAGGAADAVVTYGRVDDVVLVGDWDSNGVETFAVRRAKDYHVKNTLTGGAADALVTYGRADDVVLVGDWNDSGADTFAVRRSNVYHLRNSLTGGPADVVQGYGRSTDEVHVGDWDGDGVDTLGIRRLG